MKEILFRGKRKDNGEWVYGYYVKLPHPLTAFLKDYIVVSGFDDKRESGYQDFILVEPETVGQFTGLYDKNGKEVYEGDIIEIVNNLNEATMKRSSYVVVKFKGYGFVATWIDPDGEVYNHFDGYNTPVVTFEVIGNIHDKE